MPALCIAFLPCGEFESLYSDVIAEDPAVTVTGIKRYSNVEFEGGEWVARLPGGEEICRHKLRGECLKLEARHAADYMHQKRKEKRST
jgi:hypothetical protein